MKEKKERREIKMRAARQTAIDKLKRKREEKKRETERIVQEEMVSDCNLCSNYFRGWLGTSGRKRESKENQNIKETTVTTATITTATAERGWRESKTRRREGSQWREGGRERATSE